jgi:hypothetical protein
VTWSFILIEAFILAIEAGYAIYTTYASGMLYSMRICDVHADDYWITVVLRPGLAVLILFLVLYIAGQKQLLYRILGEKGTTTMCDSYESFVFGPLEPLFICILLSGIYGMVNAPFFNFLLGCDPLGLDPSFGVIAQWLSDISHGAHALRTTAIVFLVFAWVGVAVLSACNFAPLVKGVPGTRG